MNGDEIKALYEKASECLWNVKKASYWSKDYETGYFYLYSALHEARLQPEKNHLTYARILATCAYEQLPGHCGYDLFWNYIQPAYEEYQLAMKETGEQPSAKEQERIESLYDYWQYKMKHEDTSDTDSLKASLALIENSQLLDECDGIFYDCKFISFAVDEPKDMATLVVKYDDWLITVRFETLFDTYLSCDPVSAYVGDFCCYREWHNKDRITFDIGFLKVTCKKVSVVEVREKGKEA